MSMKEAYEKKLEARLEDWNADISKLKARADAAEADAQLEYYKQIEDLRSKQDEAKKKLNELKDASEDAWQDLKIGIESAWESLGSSVKSAKSHFG
ncbi:MAG TPA: hypothetical protein VKN62_08640 [Pelovirga sp.]|nr:hypothetical protein [Pelovirga sp.]